MAVFRFRLEKILQLRFSEENQIKLQLASIRARIRIVEQEAAEIENEIGMIQRKLTAECSTGKTGFELQQWRWSIQMLNWLLEQKKSELSKLKKAEEETRERFLTVRRDRQVLEKLKLRRFQTYLFEQDRLNRLYLDEVALRRFVVGGGKTES